jgi:hypothetical protein
MPSADAEQGDDGYLYMLAPKELVCELFVEIGVPCDGVFGRFIYHRRVASLKVPDSSLNLRGSAAPIRAIWVQTAIRCSRGSVLPSNDGRFGILKFSGIGFFQSSSASG